MAPQVTGEEAKLSRQERTSLATQLVSQITLTARLLSDTSAASRSDSALTPASLAVLQAIAREGQQGVPEIARSQAVSRQNVQMIINRMLARGYVEELSNPAHKRSLLFTLTEAGHSILADHKTARKVWETKLVESLDGAELHAALSALSRIHRWLATETRCAVVKSQMTGQPKPSRNLTRNRTKVRRPSRVPDFHSVRPVSTPPDSTFSEPTELPYNLL
jgi:DNA-binding MarR family transcriptional regulator